MKVVVFEDDGFKNLYPLTYLRPLFELRCGGTSLLEKIKRLFPEAEFAYFVRDYLKPKIEKEYEGKVNDFAVLKDELVLVNARLLSLEKNLFSGDKEEAVLCKGEFAWARVSRDKASSWRGNTIGDFIAFLVDNLPKREIEASLIKYPWDLVNYNPRAIEVDFKILGKNGIEGKFSNQAVVYGDEKAVYVAEGAEIHPYVVLDTTHGPVIVEKGVEIFPFSRVEGPAIIGEETQIMSGAKIREGTSIGPVCRVGGEVEESIIHGYSNKYHDGFLGHAYVCEWVNLGALTTNSDLKNNYSTVSVYINGEGRDSGSTKVGSYIGDHSKTSIGTLLNTGTVIGVMCNVVAGAGVAPKFIPSFSWYIKDKVNKDMGMRMALKTASTAMGRRGKELKEEDIRILEYLRDLTKEERMELVRKGRK